MEQEVQQEFGLTNDGNPAPSIEGLSKERKKKVRQVKGKLRRGSFDVDLRAVDDKTMSGLLEDIK